MNHDFTRLGSRLYSPNLNDVVGLEDSVSDDFSYAIHLSINYFFSLNCIYPVNFRDKYLYGKLEKFKTEHFLAKLYPSNFVNAIFYLLF